MHKLFAKEIGKSWYFFLKIFLIKDQSLDIMLLQNVPMNINGYVPFLINKLDAIMRGGNMLTK